MPVIHVAINTSSNERKEVIKISETLSLKEVRAAMMAAADIAEHEVKPNLVMKLYNLRGSIVPIGPHIPANKSEEPYKLVLTYLTDKVVTLPAEVREKSAKTLKATQKILEDVATFKKEVKTLTKKIESSTAAKGPGKPKGDPTKKLAMQRVSQLPFDEILEASKLPVPTFKQDILDHLKHPTFDIWKFDELELAALLEQMFYSLNLVETFKIDIPKLRVFLHSVRFTYNLNPFHNFRHCFCVSQMMYAIIHVTGVHAKLTSIEKLVLLCSAIGHDLDHPGMNNAYQINASTDFAIIYNDISPLENHHAAVLFTLLKDSRMNFLSNLTDPQFRDFRKNAILCVLATDMAKHGEILGKFKTFADSFNFDDANQRQLLLQMIIKCSDISNEVRPKHVSEPWVDNLLEEFFTQSDKEKRDGLPTAPFMDRDKVTKPSAQVGFIAFVMIPLYELMSKVLPNMQDSIITPIKNAHEYYKVLLEAEKVSKQ